jgi:hypothetical protein
MFFLQKTKAESHKVSIWKVVLMLFSDHLDPNSDRQNAVENFFFKITMFEAYFCFAYYIYYEVI